MMRRALFVAAVGFGALCRIRQWAANASLWHDEAFVALNVLHIPFAHLLGPLDWHEPSPPGFLAAEQAMVAVFGAGEPALRALPLAAGLAALVGFAHLARQLCRSEYGALWALILFAASAKLIVDASHVKHFTCDVWFAVALLGLAWAALRAAAPRPATLLAWGGVAALGFWFSYASTFVFAGTALVLAMPARRRWPRAAGAAYAVGLGLALGSAAVLAPAVLAQRGDGVVAFWAGAFPPAAIVPLAIWVGRAVVALFDYFWQPLGGLLLAVAVVAARAHWRESRRPVLALLWLPVGLSLAASALRWWPFGGNQHMSFAAPAVLLLAGDGLELVRRWLAVRAPRLAACALAGVLLPGVGAAVYHLAVPRQRHDVRAAIAFMRAHADPGDQVAVFDQATFAYYTGDDRRGVPPPLDPSRRVWVVTPRSANGRLQPDVQRLLGELGAVRRRQLGREPAGAAAYLFGPER